MTVSHTRHIIGVIALVLTTGAAIGGQQAAATTAGDLHVQPPTQLSLGFDWIITGDANRNARVDVSFRKTGAADWRQGLPLLRLMNEVVGRRAGGSASPFDYVAPNMFSGSLLNLEPGAEYEVRLTLSDPDGVTGETMRTVTARTRPETSTYEGGSVYHVYPIGWDGPKQEPSFIGLIPAYYITCHTSDWQNAYPARVKPGDTILVHAGLYIGNRYYYPGSGNPPGPDRLSLCTLFDGTYYFTESGTPERPITIKAAGDGEVIFDGDGAHNLFNLMAANYNHFEGITVRNTDIAFLTGTKHVTGASGFSLRKSRVYDVGRAVQADWSGARDFDITDNVFIGRHDPFRMMGWSKEWQRFPGYPALIAGPTGSDYAVKIYGQGHVVARNFVANWHDGIDVATYGNPDADGKDPARMPVSIDIHDNDITNMSDNCIEADGGARNVRVFRNRCFNAAGGALSADPVLGGPVYFFNNLVYNTPTGGALRHTSASAGLLVYQNTFIGEAHAGPTSNQHFLNNLILGSDTAAPVFSLSTFTSYSTSNYNGFRPNQNASHGFEWGSPASAADYARLPERRTFRTLREYSEATGQDRNSVLLDYDVFVNVEMPDRTDLQRMYWSSNYDFRLRPGAVAVDAGTAIPTITDGFSGKAPDLGAFELGAPLPEYGPRGMKQLNPSLKVTPRGGPPSMRGVILK